MADVLLDTTFFIDLRRGDQSALEIWQQIRQREVAASYSSVTAYELWLSKDLDSSDETFFRILFTFLEEAPLTVEAATQTAIWLRDLARRTRDRRLRDAFIAASARISNTAILTRNVSDMRRYHSNVRGY